MKHSISNIGNDYNSYQRLITFYNSCVDASEIELSLTSWFSANMSATLGAILEELNKQGTFCNLGSISSGIKIILQKNGFLCRHFGAEDQQDRYHTTIPYKRLTPNEGNYFNDYVSHQLFDRTEMPKMSQGVKDKMTELIHELFVNAQMHSNTEQIYTCGQFFPRKDKIEFTLVDTGIGFRDKVNQKFNSQLSALQAIKWAVQDRATTKDVTGGLGLAMLKEFTEHNKGKIQIISADGFYQFENGIEETKQFKGAFPGTIINIQFRTDDNSSYILKNELDINDIF